MHHLYQLLFEFFQFHLKGYRTFVLEGKSGGHYVEETVVQETLHFLSHQVKMELEIDASALLVYRAAWAHDQNQGRVTREASMAKLYATEKAQQVIDTAVQLFGARGVEKGNPVESLYREIRALRIYEGASEVHQQILGDQAIRSYNGDSKMKKW